MPRSLVLLSVLWLCLATQAQAQAPAFATPGRSSSTLQERFTSDQRSQRATLVEADAIRGTPDVDLHLQGRASLRRADILIRAERMDYDVVQDRLNAQGDVKVDRAGNIFEGTELDLKVDAFSGFFTDTRYRFLRNDGYGQASRIEFIDAQAMLLRAPQYPRHHDAVGGACLQQADLMKEFLTGLLFELSPKLIGAKQKGNVVGVLKIGLPYDPRLAVRTALVVARWESVQGKHTRTAPSEMNSTRKNRAPRMPKNSTRCW